MNIRKLITIVFGLLLVHSFSLTQQWVKIPMHFSTGDTSFWYWEATFVTKDVGFYSAAISDTIGPLPVRVFKTTNGGSTWELIKDQGRRNGFYNLFALDSLHLWGRAGIHWIQFTSDGGVTWDSSYVDSAAKFPMGPLFFFNTQEGFVFGTYLFLTTDGGKTWGVENYKDSLLIQNTGVVDFANRRQGWTGGGHPVGTDNGAIGVTFDSGKSWSFINSAIITGLDFIDSLTGFAVGFSPFEGDEDFYSTRDGGIHWNGTPIQRAGGYYDDVGFIDSLCGWVSGYTGQIWYTSDGGTTWTLQHTGVSANLKKIKVFREERVVYVFGDSLTLLRADLTTDIHEDFVAEPAVFTISQNYPNPFNPSTLINYELPKKSYVTLKVYNVLGQEVATLVNEMQEPGYKSVKFDANTLSSGLYFYKLQAGSFFEVKKMLLIK